MREKNNIQDMKKEKKNLKYESFDLFPTDITILFALLPLQHYTNSLSSLFNLHLS